MISRIVIRWSEITFPLLEVEIELKERVIESSLRKMHKPNEAGKEPLCLPEIDVAR